MSKEKRPIQSPTKDPEFSFDRSQFFENRLSLPNALKEHLAKEGLDYRFLNAAEFRKNGNRHQSHWRAYVLPENYAALGVTGVTPERLIQVGDLILGVREKRITKAHKEFLSDQNTKYNGYNKQKAKEMRVLARQHGVEEDADIHEGYDDNN